MFYITKGEEPKELRIFRKNIETSKKNYNWDSCPQQVKEEVKYSLAIEQNCLCAYCTRKIDEHCNIEHFYSRASFPNKMFDYGNMLGVDNKRILNSKYKNLCEDGRGSKYLTINPLNKTIIDKIYYLSDGTIKHDLYQNDLDDILHLNDSILKNARLNILKNFKKFNISPNQYDNFIKIYRNEPYGSIVIYYIKQKKADPNFNL